MREATDASIAKLDGSFFRVRFDRLTPREKEYMRAIAHLGPGAHRSGDIAECLGVEVRSIAPLRSGLMPCAATSRKPLMRSMLSITGLSLFPVHQHRGSISKGFYLDPRSTIHFTGQPLG